MNAPMDDQRLDEILDRANAATKGPWCTDAWEIYQGTEYVPGISFWIGETCRGTADLEQDSADAAFIAAARTDVPELVAELVRLRQERHSTNEALSEAAEQLRVQRDRIAELETELAPYRALELGTAEGRISAKCENAKHPVWLRYLDDVRSCPWCRIAELEALTPAPIQTCQTCGSGYDLGQPCSVCAFHVIMEIAEKKQRQAEDPHDSPLHHDYADSRDLPFVPRQVTGRCPKCNGTFEDCTCGGAA